MIRFVLIVATALLVGCTQPKQQLNIFIWSDYLDPKIVADFEKQFDCKLTIDLYETSESMMAKMAADGASIYDIVVPSSRTLPIMVNRGLLAPLRHENIPNLTNVAPQFVNPFFDPGNRYGAPFSWDTSGIYLRKPKDKPVKETWGLIFDASKQLGPFLLSDDVRPCVGAFINPIDRNNPTIYPSPEVMQRLEFARDLGEQNKLYDEIWTQIKSK